MSTLASDVERLDNELARLTLPTDATRAPAAVGIEHEYRVLRGDRAVDFRALVHDLAIDGRRLDPGDANAYRCSWGGQITCDEAEAEVVTPPEPAAPGFAPALLAWTAAGRRHLASRLDPAHGLQGFSTHLSVSTPGTPGTPGTRGERICHLATRTFGPGLMLVLDGPSSHGIAIRPRPGRAELCGEFADGDRLAAAAVFWTGAVLATTAAAGGDPSARAQLPPPVAANTAPDVERYGWVLYRNAFGFDLYAQGRTGRFERASGGTISAQSHLELAWEGARAALEGVTSHAELALVDAMVAGRLPLGIEDPRPSARPMDHDMPRRPVFGEVLETSCAGPYEAVAVIATWDHTVFRIRQTADAGGRAVFACIPRPHLPQFLDGLATGRLTPVITRALAAAPIERVLDNWTQTATPGFYGALRATRLTAPERHPLAAPADESALMRWAATSPARAGAEVEPTSTEPRAATGTGAGPGTTQPSTPTRERVPDRDRPGKWRTPHDPTGTGLPWWAWVILVVLVSFGAGALVGYLTGEGGTTTGSSTATTAPVTTSTAAPSTTTATTVVTPPEITAACVFTDHFPRAADYPGVSITTPSVIVADLTVRGVAPGTELNVLVSRPRILQGVGIVDADGHVRVVMGISSYGRYEIAAVTLGDGTRPAPGPMPSVHVVDAAEPGCT